MKKIQFIILALIFTSVLNAQTLEQGVSLFNEEQYIKAKQLFTSLNKQTPSAEVCYQLGETYFKLGQIDSAQIAYQQGITLISKYFYNYAGLGKVQMQKGDLEAAKVNFDKVRKNSKKDIKLLMTVVDAAITVSKKDTALAHQYLYFAEAIDPKSPYLHLFYGDFNLAIRNSGQAINDYNNALYYGADKETAYIRLGGLYARVRNFKDSELSFKKAIESNPNSTIAYKKMGDMYYSFGKYADAKTAYATYSAKVTTSEDEKEKFALILFFNKNYDETESLINEIAAQNKDNSVLYRIRAYTAYERADYQKGLEYMNQFFSIQKADKVIPLDYEYNAKLLVQTGKDSLAINSYLKAFEMDTTKYQDIEEVVKIYAKNKKHENAIKYYSLLNKYPQQDKSNLAYSIGKEYYFDGGETKSRLDSVEKRLNQKKLPLPNDFSVQRANMLDKFVKADSCFSIVNTLSPRFGSAYLFKGRTQAIIDPESKTDKAKNAYESYLAIAQTSKTPDNVNIIESYAYLASYYYFQSLRAPQNSELQKTNKQLSINYFEKIIALDPTDKQANDALLLLKKK